MEEEVCQIIAEIKWIAAVAYKSGDINYGRQ